MVIALFSSGFRMSKFSDGIQQKTYLQGFRIQAGPQPKSIQPKLPNNDSLSTHLGFRVDHRLSLHILIWEVWADTKGRTREISRLRLTRSFLQGPGSFTLNCTWFLRAYI